MKIKKKIFLLCMILIIITIPVKAENHGGNLKIRLEQRVFNLNPIYAANESETLISRQIFDTLFTYDSKGNIIPNLAANWEINDEATVFIINLKKDIYFQDYSTNGKKLTEEEKQVSAEDWKWSFEYLAASENKSPYADLLKKIEGYSEYRQNKKENISGINVLNKYTLKIKLNEPYAPFIYNLTESALSVIPKEVVKNDNFNFSLNPIGTGAFALENFSSNKIVLKKNNNYWKNNKQGEKLPYLEKVEFNFTGGEVNNKKNNFDILKLTNVDYLNYKENKAKYSGYMYKKVAQNNIYYLAFKNKNNEDIAELFKQKIKEAELLKELNLTNYIPAAELENNYYALKEMSSANTENEPISIANLNDKIVRGAANNFKTANQISDFLKDEMENYKINLKLTNRNWAKHLKKLQVDNFDFFLMSYDYKNKFDFLVDNFYSSSAYNYFNYKNERVDNLIEYIKLESNSEKRQRAYKVIKDILTDTSPYIFLLQESENYLVNNNLANSEILDNIYLKDKLELLYFK